VKGCRVTILGCGFSGLAIAHACRAAGADVLGTRRSAAGLATLSARGVAALPLDGPPDAALVARLGITTHLICSVAPARQPPLDDPMLALCRGLAAAGRLPSLRWIGYLSTIGVYGDHGGARVDEDTPCTSEQPRSIVRREAELGWTELGAGIGCSVALLRLSGIYGPGRNAVRDALAGRARMLIKPGQVFNRIHVQDLACAAVLAAEQCIDGVLNITDDEPAPPQDVIRYAHRLIGRDPPPAVDVDTAEISPMARSFYRENKRVDNARSRRRLGLRYAYPDYRTGLAALLDGELADPPGADPIAPTA